MGKKKESIKKSKPMSASEELKSLQKVIARLKKTLEVKEWASRKTNEGIKLLYKDLALAKDYTDNIIKSIIDTLIVVDPDANIKTINKATSELLGYKEDELIDKPVATIFAEEEEEEEEETPFKGTRMKKLMEEGSIRDYDMTYKTKSGEKIPVSFSGSVMRDKDGNLVGIVGIAHDMREIRRLMQKEKELAAAAAAAAAERKRADELADSQRATINILEDVEETKEVLEKKTVELEKAYAELHKLDQLKSAFVSTVSHELRTPLSITKEGISLVLDKTAGEINEKQEKMLGTAKSNIDRLARIIDDLLDVSKIEAGKVELKRELVDIAGLIRQLASSFELNLKEKNLGLKVNVPKKQIDAFVDPDKITQVFTNLIGNALKFTERGYVEISLQEKEKEIVCIVADTGSGIDKEDLPKVFSKFEQFGRLPGPGAKGTGLGLSITKGIIELHGGKIWVESKLGAGTKFSFILPKYTTEEIFKEYLNNGMREAMDKKACMTLIVISITEFNKLKQEFSDEKIGAILRSMEGIIKDTLRRKGDVVLKDSGELVVILADCDKEATSSVEKRLKEALDKYLTDEKLSGEIELRFGSAIYPDDAKNDTELIEKAKKA